MIVAFLHPRNVANHLDVRVMVSNPLEGCNLHRAFACLYKLPGLQRSHTTYAIIFYELLVNEVGAR